MLPKSERLKDRSLFNFIFNPRNKMKRRLSSNLLSLYYLFKRKDINKLPKAAFIVGLKVDKRATKRNLIKRRMRAAYQLIKNTFLLQNKTIPNVLIWIANPGIKNSTFMQIRDTMEDLLRKIN
ncbi:MAG: ribonuclease P protein component [Candidatus Melainabacteria bacterium]|nr:ribonuclease P protein component [Candidatus Melainabacteria bacterium]